MPVAPVSLLFFLSEWVAIDPFHRLVRVQLLFIDMTNHLLFSLLLSIDWDMIGRKPKPGETRETLQVK